jgi:hypothetical protein
VAYKKFGVGNYERWGLLIKTWATGRDYIGGRPDRPATSEYSRLPATVEEFKHVVLLAGVDPENLDLVTKVDFAPLLGPGHLVIRLARPMMIEQSEAMLSGDNGKPYGLPEFYAGMFDAPAGTVRERDLKPEDRLKAHAQRIGDYTLSVCI